MMAHPLSQNRSPLDQAGVATQLLQSLDSAAREVGELMRQNLARLEAAPP